MLTIYLATALGVGVMKSFSNSQGGTSKPPDPSFWGNEGVTSGTTSSMPMQSHMQIDTAGHRPIQLKTFDCDYPVIDQRGKSKVGEIPVFICEGDSNRRPVSPHTNTLTTAPPGHPFSKSWIRPCTSCFNNLNENVPPTGLTHPPMGQIHPYMIS